MARVKPNGFPERVILDGNTIDRLAIQALDYRDDAIARGLGYYSYNRQDLAAAAKSYVRFQCPADRYVVLLGREIVTNNTHVEYRTYTAWTGGTIGAAIPIRNLRSDTIYPTASTINYITGATPTAGTDVTNFPVYGSEGAGNRVSGGSDSNQTFRLLAPGSSFLIEWENLSASTVNIFTQYTWFELSPQVIL